MRFLLFILCFCTVFQFCLNGQDLIIERQTIASFGGFDKASNGYTLSYTAGETCVQTHTNQSGFYSIAEGFQQPLISNSFQHNCSPLTNGGSIKGNQTICSGEIATPILNEQFPSGGNGTMEYLWLSSTSGCPSDLSQQIPNANGINFSPSSLNQTTYYKRLARRSGCLDWFDGESNCIVKTVDPCGTNSCPITYRVDGNDIVIGGIPTNPDLITTLFLFDESFGVVDKCNSHMNPSCGSEFRISGLTEGLYWFRAQLMTGSTQTVLCDIFEPLEIGNPINGARIISFNGQNHQGSIVLDYTVSNINEDDVIEVQKSNSEFIFNSISERTPSATNSPSHFLDTDKSPFKGENYYRLKITSRTGVISYSSVKQITIGDIEQFGLFPNPAEEYVNIALQNFQNRVGKIQITDQLGKIRKEEIIKGTEGLVYNLSLNGLQNGIYSVWVFVDGMRPVGKKLIVSKSY